MRAKIISNAFIATMLSCILGNTACVNQINDGDEPQQGNIPINFSVEIENTTTRTSETLFEKGDKIGLFAMFSGNEISSTRYIDNLLLTCGNDNSLLPERGVFYPEGNDAKLDFISYYPYNSESVPAGSSIIPISVQTDQSNHQNYSLSDFLTAETHNIVSSPNAVILKYQHKLAKIKITLTPGEEESIDQMLKDNPRIIANSFPTRADFNLATEEISNLNAYADIIASGTWEKSKEGKLTGKELIIIPQTFNEEQSFQMEWNGRIYDCPLPANLKNIEGNTQCEINISSTQTNSYLLSGVVGEIQEWAVEKNTENTDNRGEYSAVHLSSLSFSASNIYRIYSEGTPIAEICKEYLMSETLTSQAIVSYPIENGETANLNKGTVLQLLDINKAVNGGQLSWDTEKNTFTYTNGSSENIHVVYYSSVGEALLTKPEAPLNINILKYTIRDLRSELQEYPIVKIGTQYWMREDLCATKYQDGTPIPLQTELGKGAGYFHATGSKPYFYNGEAIKADNLAPTEWRIPSEKDWDKLNNYINGNVALLKVGTWQIAGENKDSTKVVAPVEGTAMFNLYPSGTWFSGIHKNEGKVAGFWSWDYENKNIPEKTVFFMGESNEMLKETTISSPPTAGHYKALSIRCIKE